MNIEVSQTKMTAVDLSSLDEPSVENIRETVRVQRKFITDSLIDSFPHAQEEATEMVPPIMGMLESSLLGSDGDFDRHVSEMMDKCQQVAHVSGNSSFESTLVITQHVIDDAILNVESSLKALGYSDQ
jgi:hypothetical protein